MPIMHLFLFYLIVQFEKLLFIKLLLTNFIIIPNENQSIDSSMFNFEILNIKFTRFIYININMAAPSGIIFVFLSILYNCISI